MKEELRVRLLVVDDAHLLDELSTFVVQQLVQRDAAKVILTVVDGEPIPAAVQEISKVGRFDRLDSWDGLELELALGGAGLALHLGPERESPSQRARKSADHQNPHAGTDQLAGEHKSI